MKSMYRGYGRRQSGKGGKKKSLEKKLLLLTRGPGGQPTVWGGRKRRVQGNNSNSVSKGGD